MRMVNMQTARLSFFFMATLGDIGFKQQQQQQVSHSHSPKPVFLIHGLFLNTILAHLIRRIKQRNPNRVVHNTNAYLGAASFTAIQKQVDEVLGEEFRSFSDAHPGGFHLMGYSQGALICRALVQNYPQHNVHNLISIAAPNAGMYGLTFAQQVLPLRHLRTLSSASAFFYTPETQKSFSIANFWNDPHQQKLHLQQNQFFPIYDNVIRTERSDTFKAAFLKLRKFVAIQGPDDKIVIPWESGDFSYFDRFGKVVNYTQRDIYTQDLFGLRTLDQAGRFVKCTLDGIGHLEWIFSDRAIDTCIIPYLD